MQVRKHTYPIQDNVNLASSINHRRLATQLHNLPQHAHDAVLEVLQVGGEDAGGLGVVHCCWLEGGDAVRVLPSFRNV